MFQVMGLSGGNNTFELSGDVRDPTAVVLARIRKAQFATISRSDTCHRHQSPGAPTALHALGP